MGRLKPRRPDARTSARAPSAVDRVSPTMAATALAAMTARPATNSVAASAIIVQLMDPVRLLARIPKEKQPLETLALLCSAAWNASRLAIRGDDASAAVRDARRQVAALDPAFVPIFERVLVRARNLYPGDRRMFTGVTVDIVRRGEIRVNATSVDGADL